MTNRIQGEGCRATTVCIDSYKSGVPVGRIYHPCLDEGRQFHSTMQLLLDMEQILEQIEFPKAFTAMRTFAPPSACSAETSEAEQQIGETATFVVRILFRQNASWQGSVTWLEGKQSQSFRSVLELLLLMNSALQSEEEAASA